MFDNLGGMGMGGLPQVSALMGGRPGSAQSESTAPSRVQSSPGPRATTTDATPTTQASTAPTQVTPRPVTASAIPSQTERPASQSAVVTPAPGGQIQLSDLQNILSGLGGTLGFRNLNCELCGKLSNNFLRV